MTRIGGNPGLKGNENSGRKKKHLEYAGCKEVMKMEVLSELAKGIGYKKLLEISLREATHTEVKEIVLPIILKSMTEKIDHTTKGDKIMNYTDEQIKAIASRIKCDDRAPGEKKPN